MALYVDHQEELRNVDDRFSFFVVSVVYVELVSLHCIASVLAMQGDGATKSNYLCVELVLLALISHSLTMANILINSTTKP